MANIIRFGGGGGASKKKLAIEKLTEGTIVRIKEKGVLTDYYLAQHDYQPNLNGTGRTLFVRKECYNKQTWDAGQVNAYAGSDIDIWLNGDCKGMYDSAVREAMGETTFPYTPGNGNTTVTNLQRSVFLLSGTEFGKSKAQMNVEGVAVPIANLLNPVYLDGEQTLQWTRSPNTANTYVAWVVIPDGNIVSDYYCSTLQGTRWAFTLPASFSIEQNDLGTYDLVYESDYPMGYLELTIEGGTTQPTNPKDNTIWVNTDVDLGLTYLAPNAPTNPNVGDVWVNTTNKYNSNGTNASTNLIRVNDNPYLEINVLNISQWDGSAWVTRDNSAIYANGGWTNIVLYLFNYGTLNESYPIAARKIINGQSFSQGTDCLSYGSDNISFVADKTASTSSIMLAKGLVNFSNYNKLKITMKSNIAQNGVSAGTFASENANPSIGYQYLAIGTQQIPTNAQTYEIDISSWTESGYPAIRLNASSNGYEPYVYVYLWCFTA